MRKNSKVRAYLACFMAVLATLFLFACGGGGNDSNDDVKPSATMDQETAEKSATILVLNGTSSSRSKYSNNAMLSWSTMPSTAAANRINAEAVVRTGANSDSEACETSGTKDTDTSWDGPELYEDACEIQNWSKTIVFFDCAEEGATWNGTLSFAETGSYCEPTRTTITWQNVSVDEGAYHLVCTDLTSEMTEIEYDAERKPTSYKVTMHGGASANSFNVAYHHYTMTVLDNNTQLTSTVNGLFQWGCLDGWIAVKTLSPMRREDGAPCPFDGHVQITGANDVTVDVVFNADGSMDIDDRHYDTCELPLLADQCEPPRPPEQIKEY